MTDRLLQSTDTLPLTVDDLSPRVRLLKPSATLAINERSAELIKQGKPVYRLGLGQSPFPVPNFMVKSLQKYAHKKDYLPVKGLFQLREAVVQRLKRNEGIEWSPHNVLIGPGSKELIFMVQMAFQGELILPSPSWVSYAPQSQLAGGETTWLTTCESESYKLSAQQLDNLCKETTHQRRLLILNSPNNPTGACYSEEELHNLATVFRKYQILVISDEIYSDTHFKGEHVSLARFYPEGTIVSDGISKWAGAGGWRLGFMCFPDQLSWLVEAMASMASETFTSVSAPIQYAAISGVNESPQMTIYLAHCRQLLSKLAEYSEQQLSQAGISVNKAQGGFYLFPSFEPLRSTLEQQGIFTGSDLAYRLLNDCGVATLSGLHFGLNDQELILRLALVDFNGEKALNALETTNLPYTIDELFLRTYCPRVINAIKAICEWIQS